MKKLISGLLAAIMVVSISTTAFADSENEQYDMTPGYTSGLIVLRGDPSNTQHGGFKIHSGDDHAVQISFPGDYIGETTISVTNNNPNLMKIALVDSTSGSYAWNDAGNHVTILGTTFTRTSSTKYSINDLQTMADSLPTTAEFMAIGVTAGAATITCTYTPSTGAHAGESFTENIPFEIAGSSSGNTPPKSSTGASVPSAPIATSSSATFKSDTGAKLSLGTNAVYQFKITSLDGKKPTFVVPGKSFKVTANGNKGKDYFYKVKAVGKDGDSAGVYINGGKTPSTILSIKNIVKVDTGKKLTVKAGKTYQFKITANTTPTFASGNSTVFKVTYNGKKGNNYFYKVKAVGKAGQSAGFYVNSSKTPVTIGEIG